VHGRKVVPELAVIVIGSATLPPRAVAGETALTASCGAGRFADGLPIVNCNAFDVPDELETVTVTGLETVVSRGKMVAVAATGV
jgi:hypothetical protein